MANRKFSGVCAWRAMLGLLPSDVEVIIRERATRIPDAVRQEIDRLKALYDGFHYRELARILLVKVGYSIDDKTVKKLWQQSAVSRHVPLDLWDYHTHPDRYQARVRPENPKLFTDLTFFAFLLMLDQRTSPSSDTLW